MAIRANLRLGSELAGYRIEALLGRGATADVYLAFDRRLDRRVALKLLAPHLAEDERFRERFLHESKIAASLDHPHVVPIYEAGEEDEHLYIAMRYVEGTDLRRILSDEGKLEPARTVAHLGRVAEALDAAHARGLVHRDVKPANLLVALDPDADPPEHVYLSDFGLTTVSAAPGADESTRFSGTAAYAAPEQITGEPIDGRADQYGLACVLFECLTGAPPFRGDSLIAVLWSHVNDAPPAASERNPELPAAVDHVLERGLAKSPTDRYASCRELVAEAREALDVPAEAIPPLRRRWLAVAALALLAALATALAIALTRGEEAQAAPDAGGLVRIDPKSNEVGEFVQIGVKPTGIAVGGGHVWASTAHDSAIWQVDAETLAVRRIAANGIPPGIAAFGDAIYAPAWVLLNSSITRFDAASGNQLGVVEGLECVCAIGAGEDGVWFSELDLIRAKAYVMRLSTSGALRVQTRVEIPNPVPDAGHGRWAFVDLAVGEGTVWLIDDTLEQRLWRINSKANRVEGTVELGFPPRSVAVGEGAVWVTDQLGDSVARIDPTTNRIVSRIPVGRGARGVEVGAGSVWVANSLDGTVSRIDPATNAVAAVIETGPGPVEIAAGDGFIWVATDGR